MHERHPKNKFKITGYFNVGTSKNMSRQLASDILGVLRGIQTVAVEVAKIQDSQCKQIWQNSSIKSLADEASATLGTNVKKAVFDPGSLQVGQVFSETVQRSSMVVEGIKSFMKISQEAQEDITSSVSPSELEFEYDKETIYEEVENLFRNKPPATSKVELDKKAVKSNNYSQSDLIKQNTVSDKSILKSDNLNNTWSSTKTEKENHASYIVTEKEALATYIGTGIEQVSLKAHQVAVSAKQSTLRGIREEFSKPEKLSSKIVPTPTAKKPPVKKQSLSESAKQRKVPSSRMARMFSFGTLAAGLGVGTVAEFTRRSLGIRETPSIGSALDSAFLSPANAERIVNTLCKVRGAALKLGQILSIQDNNIISPQLQKAFERVRQSADFMPAWQVEKVLTSELGKDWRSKVATFDMKPFAAASIGQVHAATLHDGTEVAMKIQYPGVAQGIESDIDNLVGVLNIWNVFPEGMFIDNLVDVAKRELAWEVDYIREAECTKKFKKILEPYPEYYVPTVYDELSTAQVFTSELIEGVPVDKCQDFDMKTRVRICQLVLQLCLRELFEFMYMQTDPNWSNFFYNLEKNQLILLDFGASRAYSKNFIDQYIHVIKAAADSDRAKVLELSRNMGFLTGYESKIMEEAHVNAVMILGEMFSENAGEFDFGAQDTTKRIQQLVPTIVTHRLCPPPEEIYSLHRKLSGVFLLASKLKVKMSCRDLFMNIYKKYKFD